MKRDTYLFDFDGTLVDSMPYWSAKMINILEKSGVSYPADIIKIITPLGDEGTARYFREVLGVQMEIHEMIEEMHAYALPKYRDTIPLKDGVSEYIKMLFDAGCSLNVLTASPHNMLDPCLKRNGIYEMFDNVWSCEDFAMTKADPGIYRAVADKLGTSPGDIVFFDDNIGAVKTAASAGVCTVGVYDVSGEDFAAELKETADRYIMTFRGAERFRRSEK